MGAPGEVVKRGDRPRTDGGGGGGGGVGATPAGGSSSGGGCTVTVWEEAEVATFAAAAAVTPAPPAVALADVVASPAAAPSLMAYPFAVRMVLVMEFSERLAFYGLMSVMMPYARDAGMSLPLANGVANGFSVWAFSACLIGGYFGDSLTGLVATIEWSCLLMTLGLLFATLSASTQTYAAPGEHASAVSPHLLAYYASLWLVGAAAGGIKANVVPIIGHQLEGGDAGGGAGNSVDEEEKEETAAHGVTEVDGVSIGNGVPPSLFRWIYWCINLGALLGSVFCPLLHLVDERGTAYYASFALPCLGAACATCTFRRYKGCLRDRVPSGSLLTRCLAAYRDPEADPEMARDLRQTLYSCRVFTFFPIYWCMQKQHHTSYVPQADLMDRPPWAPSELFSALNPLTLIVGIPLFDTYVFPRLDRRGWGNMMRMLVGFGMQATACAFCMLVQYEVDSRGSYDGPGRSFRQHEGVPKVSVYWQTPGYVIIALGEIFASVGGLEFAYSSAPTSMKAVVMSLFLLQSALGSFLGVMFSPFMEAYRMAEVFTWFTSIMVAATAVFYALFKTEIRKELLGALPFSTAGPV